KWDALLGVYDELVSRIDDDLRREALIKRARLLEDGMADTKRAVEAWREVVLATEDGGTPITEHAYREAVGELERLYRGRKQWHDLVYLLEARLARAQAAAEISELRLRLADVLEAEVGDLSGALDQYEQVIQDRLGWERAVASLERLVVHDEHRE